MDIEHAHTTIRMFLPISLCQNSYKIELKEGFSSLHTQRLFFVCSLPLEKSIISTASDILCIFFALTFLVHIQYYTRINSYCRWLKNQRIFFKGKWVIQNLKNSVKHSIGNQHLLRQQLHSIRKLCKLIILREKTKIVCFKKLCFSAYLQFRRMTFFPYTI